MSQKTNRPISITILLILLLASSAIGSQWYLQKLHRAALKESLSTILSSTHQSLQAWVKEQTRSATIWARDPAIKNASQRLLNNQQPDRYLNDQLPTAAEHDLITARLLPLLDVDKIQGFIIISPDQIVLSASDKRLIGRPTPLTLQPSLLERAWRGETLLSQPLPTKLKLSSNNPATEPDKESGTKSNRPIMYSLAPIHNLDQQVIAVLGFQVDPLKDFTPLFRQSRPGISGETYAFNRSGVMISESRFTKQLQQIGLLQPGEPAILNLSLRNPGFDLTDGGHPPLDREHLPLTFMAGSAIQGKQGVNVAGYRDYRGIKVVGAWLWDNELNLGIATEINRQEASQTLTASQLISTGLTLFSIALLSSLMMIHVRHQRQLEGISYEQESILNNMSALVFIKDRQGRIRLANRALCEALHIKESDIIGKTSKDLLSPEVYERMARHDERILTEKTAAEFEEIITLDDVDHVFMMVKFPMRNRYGRIYAIGSVATDITARRNTEKALEDRERFLLSLMSNLPGAVYRYKNDDNWTISYMSQGCLVLTGYTPKAFINNANTSYLDIISIKDQEQVKQIKQSTLLHRKPFEIEYRITTADGSEKWIWERGRGIYDHKDHLTYVEGFITDISDRKRIDKELSAHRKHLAKLVKDRTQELNYERLRLNSVIENAADGIFTITPNGKFSLFSPAAQRILGYSEEEIAGKHFTTIAPDPLKEEYESDLQKIMRGEIAGVIDKTIEVELQRKDGKVIPADLSLSRNFVESDIYFTGIIRDISERKQQHFEMQKAKELAEEASNTKSEFLANMSHEIRTPMNAIIGMTQLALRTILTDKQQRYLNTINSSSKTLLGIINDILDFSKIEAGKLEIESIPFNLEDILNTLTDMSAIRAQEKQLEFIMNIEKEVPLRLKGDPLRLGQILTNLCSNAVKFTEQGEIVLHISVKERTENNIILIFSVSDTGSGMSPKQRDMLFQAFTQADSSVTREYGGTGLGLSICKNLVSLMEGEIWVESEQGKGSTFTFSLPMGTIDYSGKLYLLPDDALKGTRILVVDDHPLSLDLLSEILESFSFDITTAASAEEALDILKDPSREFDLIIMDWKMPGMSGAEATQRIKSDQTLANIPAVLMITAYGREEIMQKAQEAGADAFLVKPISTSTLFDSIIDILGEQTVYKHRPHTDNETLPTLPENITGAHLLLVEDNEINQNVAREILESSGFKVTIANHGKEALEKIAQDNFDAILMDIQMPVMDGYTATQAIRQQPQYEQLPIIAMTANAMSIDREKCLAAGMNDHLPKPIDIHNLLTTLQKWLSPEHPSITVPNIVLDDQLRQLPSTLPGFELERGLLNCSGNIQLYRTLLSQFANKYGSHDSEIKHLVDLNSLDAAQQEAHSIRGVSGNIGALELHESAKRLDLSLKQRHTPIQISEQLDQYSKALQKVIDSIHSLNQSESIPDTASNPKASLKELKQKLENTEHIDMVFFNDISQTLKNRVNDKTLLNLTDAIVNYQYQDALEVLQEVEQQLDIRE